MKPTDTTLKQLAIIKDASGVLVRFVDIRTEETATVSSDNADIVRRIKELILPSVDGHTEMCDSSPRFVIKADRKPEDAQ